MSRKEIDRLEVVRRVLERRLSQLKAAELIGLSTRQIRNVGNSRARRQPLRELVAFMLSDGYAALVGA